MKRLVLGGLATLLLVAGTASIISTPTSATGDTGWSCPAGTTHSYKLDNLSGPTFTVPDAPAGWQVLGVSIKAGRDHYDYPDAVSGDVIAVKADTGHDTSHAHVCKRRTPAPTTTEVPPSTTTTVPDTTSSTTSPPTSTTTPPTSTSTTVASSTSVPATTTTVVETTSTSSPPTTVPGSTSSTTPPTTSPPPSSSVAPTTTVVDPTSTLPEPTTTTVAVTDPPVPTTTTAVIVRRLPDTGSSPATALAAALLVGIGLTAIRLARRVS